MATSIFYDFFRKSNLTILVDISTGGEKILKMKKKKRTNKTAATMAAVMGVTAAFQSVSPIVYAQEQNPEVTSNQANIDNVTANQETTAENVTTNENTDTQAVKEETPETALQEIVIPEAVAETNVQKGVPIDAQHFPDEVFRRVVKKAYDIDDNGFISDQEIANIKSLNVNQYLSLNDDRIQNVKGIEYLTALEKLYLNYHLIENIDLSKNTNLQELYLNRNPLTSIDLSQNKALKTINLEETNISNIDLSALTQLESFAFSDTGITTIDLSHNTALKSLTGIDTELTSLDVSMLPELTRLDIRKSQRNHMPMSGLDLSHNTKLEFANIANNLCSQVNVDNCVNLKEFNCLGNRLTSLDVHDLTELTDLNCGYNQLTELDLTNLTNLEVLFCASNHFSSLDLTNQKKLRLFNGSQNHFVDIKFADEVKDSINMNDYQQIDLKDIHVKDGYDFNKLMENFDPNKVIAIVGNNGKPLEGVYFEGSILKGLDTRTMCYIKYQLAEKAILSFDVFPEVYCDEITFPDQALREYVIANYDTNKNGKIEFSELDNVKAIDLTGNKEIKDLTGLEKFQNLEILHCDNMDITSIDVSQIRNLKNLTATNIANLKNVNVSGCSQLTTLRLNKSGITSLDVTNNPELETLDCTDTKLTSIDMRKNPKLYHLLMTGTDVSTLDVTKNYKLKELQLSSTKVRSIDLSQNANLEILAIMNCHMDELDISHNPKLMNLFANYNNFTELNIDNNKNLKFLEIIDSKLTKLDVSHLSKLEILSVAGIPLKNIDVTKNAKLRELFVSNTGLTELNVRQNPALEKLECERNDLSTLDLTQNPKLDYLYCGKNHLYDIQFAEGTNLDSYEAKEQKANTIVLEDGDSYDLTQRYANDVKISNVKGATLDGMTLKDIKRGEDITYTITFENGKTLDVTLRFVLDNAWKTPLTVSDWTYGETPVLPHAEARFGDVTYTYSDRENGIFTNDIPTEAGKWYVKASVKNNQYVELNAVSSFTIHKATPDVLAPKLFASYGQTSKDVILPEGFTWKQDEVTFDHIGDYTLKALYKPKDMKNYTTVDMDVTVHVEKAKNTWINPLEIKGWYKGQTSNEPYAKAAYGDVHYVYSNQKYGVYTNTQPTQKGTWYVKAIVDDSDNFNGLVSEPVAFEIKVKEITTIIHGSIEAPKKETTKQVKKATPVASVQTGDHTNAGIFALMAMASLATLAFLGKRKKAIKK